MSVKECEGISAPDETSRPTRARRRASVKASKSDKRSLNLRIDADSYERLAIHALRRNTTISALVEQFAQENLRQFYIVNRGAGEGTAGDDV